MSRRWSRKKRMNCEELVRRSVDEEAYSVRAFTVPRRMGCFFTIIIDQTV